MTKIRGFEKISFEQFQKDIQDDAKELSDLGLEEMYEQLKFPRRATPLSAGYDIYAPGDIILQPGEMKSIATGIKVYMQDDEWFSLRVRSGHGFKYNLRLKNQVGVVDADYYNNEDNEGHMFVALQNEGDKTWTVNRGEAFAQGIFHRYLIVDNDNPVEKERKGGLGSTGKRG